MKYKAIIFDLDGTAIPNRRDGMPSIRLINTIKKIQDKVFVCAATGRPINHCRQILNALGLKSPCIVSGGTKIVDPITEKVLWSKSLSQDQLKSILAVAKNYHFPVYVGESDNSGTHVDRVVTQPANIVYIEPVTPEGTEKIFSELKKINDIAFHTANSWTDGHFDLQITHKDATKGHAVEELLKMLNVKKEETIGFGDSNNDLPIFEKVGYKVAMDNASEDLKKAADFIAPHAESEGLAEAIEKLVV